MNGRAMRTATWVALLLVAPSGAWAQGASLDRVEELVRFGRPEEARTALLQWWDGPRTEAARRDLQRGLWLRGRLTVDPVQAELDFQRLVVLYPRGPYTAQAILRLAQAAWAMGDEASARAHVAALGRDFSSSPVRAQAESWLRGAGPLPPRVAAPVDAGAPRTEGAQDRPDEQPPPPAQAGEPSPGASDDPPATVAEQTEAAATGSAGIYYVQLGAFAEEGRAMALFDEVSDAGLDVRIVRVAGSRFLHVRFGRFVQRAEAADELERLTGMGINAALVRDARPELPVRD